MACRGGMGRGDVGLDREGAVWIVGLGWGGVAWFVGGDGVVGVGQSGGSGEGRPG